MSEPGTNELLSAALNYATQGWYVFPIAPGRKRPPLIEKQYTHSTTDPDTIRAWWQDNPKANIGLDCGKSGLVMVDVDTAEHGKGGKYGEKVFAGLVLLTGRKAWNT